MSAPWRTVRVFISSTFRDMQAERDWLVRFVFPRLREELIKFRIHFVDVDLRWGVTGDQDALGVCREIIDECHPRFMCMLGGRYGWIPDAIRPEVVEREPWLREHVEGRRSVTELEILHGVFNDPTMQARAFFYFRDPAYANDPALSEKERWDMVEHDIPGDIERYGPAEAARRAEQRKARLAALKEAILESDRP